MENKSKKNKINQISLNTVISKDDLCNLGIGNLCYIKTVTASDLSVFFPDIPLIDKNITLWALLNADGTPVLVADTKEAVLANAFEQDLQMTSLH